VCVADGEREGECECEGVRRANDIEGVSVEVEGESEVPFRRKEDGGGVAPDPVWGRRRERYGLLPPPFRLSLILLVLPFTLEYCIPALRDGVSDARETSLRM
jgi:hypothetical protein